MSETFDDRGPGGWRGADTLEMGTGRSGRTDLYAVCSHCHIVKNVGETTAGIICNNCNKYFSIDKRYTFKQLQKEIKKGNIKVNEKENNNNLPHLRIEGKNEHYKFRQNMEQRAERFKQKQIASRKHGNAPRLHGPIDPKTGKQSK